MNKATKETAERLHNLILKALDDYAADPTNLSAAYNILRYTRRGWTTGSKTDDFALLRAARARKVKALSVTEIVGTLYYGT